MCDAQLKALKRVDTVEHHKVMWGNNTKKLGCNQNYWVSKQLPSRNQHSPIVHLPAESDANLLLDQPLIYFPWAWHDAVVFIITS